MSQTEVARAESLDEQDPHRRENDSEKKPKNKRPASAHPELPCFKELTKLYILDHCADLINLTRYRLSAATSQGMAVSANSLEASRRC